MQQHQGTVVEELMIKFGFDNRLVNHINTWVAFAVSSQTKSLALDLPPHDLLVPLVDQYIFPVDLLDNRSIF